MSMRKYGARSFKRPMTEEKEMSEVKRYMHSDQRGAVEVHRGKYILFEDYAALKAERDAQLAELAKQKPAAWLNTRQGDPTWPRVFVTEEKAEANREWVTLAPRVKTQPLFTRPAPAAPAAVPVDLVPECKWTYNENDYFWSAACGGDWQFTDGGPKENRVNFCQGCGGMVRVIEELK